MTPRHSTAIRQYYTHRKLVRYAAPLTAASRTRHLDAIIVPASRAAGNLKRAIALARAARCQLVLLCSLQTRIDDVSQLLASHSFSKATVIEVSSEYTHHMFDFYTSLWAELCLPATRSTDLSLKRNVGLIIARLLGWQRIFFMDDDIEIPDSDGILHTVGVLGRYAAVGLRVATFPDNSVVCHAHRETGGFQDVHVSGSALAVDCTAPISFFPNVYNEDWLFFYNDAAQQRLGWSDLRATQLRYDPFADPRRAARQEFGDVLAEGLYAQLHTDRYGYATTDYWGRFLDARERFLGAIIDRIEKAKPELRPKIRDSVETAQHCLAQTHPYHYQEYIELWNADLHRWSQRLDKIPTLPTMRAALDSLGLVAAEGSNTDNAAPFVVDMRMPAPPLRAMIPDMPLLGGIVAASAELPAPGFATGYIRELAPAWVIEPKSRMSSAHDARRAWTVFPGASRMFVLSAALALLPFVTLWEYSSWLATSRGPLRRISPIRIDSAAAPDQRKARARLKPRIQRQRDRLGGDADHEEDQA